MLLATIVEIRTDYPILRVIIWIALLVFYIYMAQYIYKDAVKRELNAELWLLIVLLVPIASWIVYFLVRNEKSQLRELKKTKS
jgi:hypothetical protein